MITKYQNLKKNSFKKDEYIILYLFGMTNILLFTA